MTGVESGHQETETTGIMNCQRAANATTAAAFTLRELIVVLIVFALLAGPLIAATHRAASRRIKQAQCAANLQQFAAATHLYATENRDRLPEITIGTWAWDMPVFTTSTLLQHGMTKRTFYCPGTAPRFNDSYNFLNSYPNSLWTWAETGPINGFRIIGYLSAFTGPAVNPSAFSLILSNQNKTILPEPPRVNATGYLPIPGNHERVLLADATISEYRAGTPAAPGPAGSFTSVAGGFSPGGTTLPHLSPHLKGNLPAGGNLAYKDGHVAWRKFAEMQQRASGSSRGFWW